MHLIAALFLRCYFAFLGTTFGTNSRLDGDGKPQQNHTSHCWWKKQYLEMATFSLEKRVLSVFDESAESANMCWTTMLWCSVCYDCSWLLLAKPVNMILMNSKRRAIKSRSARLSIVCYKTGVSYACLKVWNSTRKKEPFEASFYWESLSRTWRCCLCEGHNVESRGQLLHPWHGKIQQTTLKI